MMNNRVGTATFPPLPAARITGSCLLTTPVCTSRVRMHSATMLTPVNVMRKPLLALAGRSTAYPAGALSTTGSGR